mgnify:CR=1 FL=1
MTTASDKIVIFDLDGTLLNTIDDLGYACNHALQQSGLPVYPIERYPSMVGNGVRKLIERALLPMYESGRLADSGETEIKTMIETVMTHFVPYYDTHNCVYTHPYKGIPELLKGLKQQGYMLAVASNKYQSATQNIVNHFFPDTFDAIFGEREGIPRKPNPRIVYDILQTLNIAETSSSSIYVGDSLVDRDTATNAGMPFVACSWGFVSRDVLIEGGVEHIINNPLNLLNFEIL